jgi:hypothetical protein
MKKAEIIKMIKRLERAYVCCKKCGDEYGVYSVGCSSTWNDVCDVCDKLGPVTEARDYAYLVTGLRRLYAELDGRAGWPSNGRVMADETPGSGKAP